MGNSACCCGDAQIQVQNQHVMSHYDRGIQEAENGPGVEEPPIIALKTNEMATYDPLSPEPAQLEKFPGPEETPVMAVGFRVGESAPLETRVFRYRPLGVDFQKNVPVIVRIVHAGGQTEDLGIKEGWAVAQINGVSLDGKSFEEIYNMLLEAAAVMPSKS